MRHGFVILRAHYSRSREFIRWLISKGLTKQIDGLDESASKAMG